MATWMPAGRTPCSRTLVEDVEALGSGFVAAVEERLVAEMLGHRTGRVNIVFIVFTSDQSEAAWVPVAAPCVRAAPQGNSGGTGAAGLALNRLLRKQFPAGDPIPA